MNPSNLDLLNLESVDDWLETDLLESGIVLAESNPVASITPAQIHLASPPISECTPYIFPLSEDSTTPSIDYKPLSPIRTPKIESHESPKPSATVMKALVLLSSLQTNQSPQKQQKRLQHQQQQNNGETANPRIRRKRTKAMSEEAIITLKRQRNTDAARRSRLRKALKMEALEKQVAEMLVENEKLKLKIAATESECLDLKAKEKQDKLRILELERQLADVNKALLQH